MGLVAQIVALAQRIAQQFNNLPQPVYYIWAEQGGFLRNNRYEWSFGNGIENEDNYVVLMGAGFITNISLSVDREPRSTCTVEVLIKRGTNAKQSAGSVSLNAGSTYQVAAQSHPFAVQSGDRLQFRTVTGGSAQRGTVAVEISL